MKTRGLSEREKFAGTRWLKRDYISREGKSYKMIRLVKQICLKTSKSYLLTGEKFEIYEKRKNADGLIFRKPKERLIIFNISI